MAKKLKPKPKIRPPIRANPGPPTDLSELIESIVGVVAALNNINESIREAIKALPRQAIPSAGVRSPFVAGQWRERDGDKFPRGA